MKLLLRGTCEDPQQEDPFTAMLTWGAIAFEIANPDPVVISTHRIKTSMSCASGDSGSDYYYEPVLGSPQIVGLHSSWVGGAATYCGGPRAAEFRDFVIANL